MTYEVILRYPCYDHSLSWAAARWCEFTIGGPWDGWVTHPITNDDGKYFEDLFVFEKKMHAEQFQNIFCRDFNGYQIFAYDTYRYFWINQFGRDRLDNAFSEKGWTPEAVIPSFYPLPRKRGLTGGRMYFRRQVGWFFEREQDAMIFLLFELD